MTVKAGGGQDHGRRGAVAELAFEAERSAMQLGEGFADGQAKPRAAMLARARIVNLSKGLKHLVDLLGWNADARIGNRQFEIAVPGKPDRHVDAAVRRGEFRRVREQVEHDLAYRAGIGAQPRKGGWK